MKYKMTDETMDLYGNMLHRIECVTPFRNVKAGEKGGWIEDERNLSQIGDAWVSDDAKVYGSAEVSGSARVSGDAWVSGNAWVSDDAKVYGSAEVSGSARVSGNAVVSQGCTPTIEIKSAAEWEEYRRTLLDLKAKFEGLNDLADNLKV